jgi:hypothetical protein
MDASRDVVAKYKKAHDAVKVYQMIRWGLLPLEMNLTMMGRP